MPPRPTRRTREGIARPASIQDMMMMKPTTSHLSCGMLRILLVSIAALLCMTAITMPAMAATAAFSASPMSGTAPLSVTFTDASTTNPTAWAWDFDNDGTIDSTDQNPVHVYTAAGTYSVNLTATDAEGTNSVLQANLITVSAAQQPPVAGFAANVVSGTAPLTIVFTDQSTNTPTAWAWDFDNDGVVDSTAQNPSYIYTTAGTYTVNLTATNAAGSDSEVKEGYVTVSSVAAPVAAFSAAPTSGSAPLTVAFTDASTNSPTAWAWDFNNDGVVDSTAQNPSYIYTTAGTYTVNLTAINAAGSDDEVKTGYVTVSAATAGLADTPWPKFGINAKNTGQSAYNGPQSNHTLWKYLTQSYYNYGSPAIGADGTIYTGSYDHGIWALNPDGTLKWNITKGGQIISSPAIGADGTLYLGSKNANLTALNPDGTTKWSYIAGGQITGSPAIGTDGTIYVGCRDNKFYAINPDGTLKWYYTTGGMIIPSGGSPALGSDGTIYFGSNDFKLYALNTDGTLKWAYNTGNWIYGSPAIGSDGTVYVGSNNAKLYAINSDGTLKWTYSTGSTIYGSPAIATDGTIYIGSGDNYLYALNPDGSLRWKSIQTGTYSNGIKGAPAIGADGTIYMSNSEYSRLYAFNPNGSVKWFYKSKGKIAGGPAIGADGALYLTSDDGYTYAFKDIAPVANFTSKVTGGIGGYVPLTIQFTDTSLYTPSSWLWDFGDGTISPVQNPAHTYTAAGTYTVTLTSANAAGSNTIVKTGYLTLLMPSEPPVANYTAIPLSGEFPLTVRFTDQSTGIVSFWAWDFNNDGTVDSTLQNPNYTYSTAGIYTVNLTVTNGAGSGTDIKTDYITVSAVAPPVVAFTATPTSGAAPLTVTFNDTSSNTPISWAWDFNNDGIIDATTRNTTHSYTTAGTYTVNLTATNAAGSDSEVKTGFITVSGTADLSVASVATLYPGYNMVTATISNIGTGDAVASRVLISVDGNTTSADVAAIVAGSSTTVSITDTVWRKVGQPVPVTITVDSENTIAESNETNNVYSTSAAVARSGSYYNGGRSYSGHDIETGNYTEGHEAVVYALGSGYQAGGAWYSTTDTWTAADLPVPANATVKAARLYQSYTWSHTGNPGFTVQFNGNTVGQEAFYGDGIEANADVDDFNGQAIYDVTPYFSRDGNTALITATAPSGGLYGAVLVVVYEDAGQPYRKIWLNEGCDSLLYGTATGYAMFNNVTTTNLHAANVTTMLPSGGDNGQSYVLFNSQSVALTGTGGSDPGFKYYDVTSALEEGTNELGVVQDGYMNFAAAILQVEYSTPAAPVAAFSADATSGAAPLTVVFTDTSANAPTSWAWDFGDGDSTNATMQNPVHTYASAGTYTVTLTATNAVGSDSETMTDYITVTPTVVAPVAAFSADTTSGAAPLTVVFTDASTNAPASWLWDFGDGSSTNATMQNPVHTYAAAGTYTVTLTATNTAGSDSETITGYITVTGQVLVALPDVSALPTDPDSDGLYEDMNGNGRNDKTDVTLFNRNLVWVKTNEPNALFDFSGNGRIDKTDVTMLNKYW
jgi:PKD repeat protein